VRLDHLLSKECWRLGQRVSVRVSMSSCGALVISRCWVLRKRTARPAVVQGGYLGLQSRPVSSAIRMDGLRGRFRLFFENCTVDASISCFCEAVTVVCSVYVCQVYKSTRWMPWHQEPMKDAGACDIPRGAGNQALIRGFPNGET
jgi:hypothetical protein